MRTIASLLWKTVAVTAMAIALSGALPATDSSVNQDWTVTTSDFADLWYHGLAIVGAHGPGPRSLYAPGYGARHRPAEAGSLLSQRASGLRERFRSDPALEVLHFVPVYLYGASIEEGLAIMYAVAAGESVKRENPRFSRAADAVARVLTSVASRETLGAFVEALDAERASASVVPGSNPEVVEEVRAGWAGLSRTLSPSLAALGFDGGTLVLSPQLGDEGRFFEGRSDDPSDALVFVFTPSDSRPAEAVLMATVRELCFPAVRRAFRSVERRIPDRSAAAQVSDRAATRCGALLLERHAPEWLGAYQQSFPDSGAGWARALPVADAAGVGRTLEAALNQELTLR